MAVRPRIAMAYLVPRNAGNVSDGEVAGKGGERRWKRYVRNTTRVDRYRSLQLPRQQSTQSATIVPICPQDQAPDRHVGHVDEHVSAMGIHG